MKTNANNISTKEIVDSEEILSILIGHGAYLGNQKVNIDRAIKALAQREIIEKKYEDELDYWGKFKRKTLVSVKSVKRLL